MPTSRAEDVAALAAARAGEPGPLLEVLHDVQGRFGWIDDADLPVIADALLLSIAEVHGVVSFYDDLRTTAPPRHHVAVCRGEACQARGGQGLYDDATAHWANEDDVEVGEVFCLGLCAIGPAAMIDGKVRARMDAPSLRAEVGQ